MTKKWMIPAVILCAIGLLFITGKATGLLQTYTIPTLSNEPTIKKGDRIWVSNLVKPKRFNFITFRQEKGQFWEGGTWLMRLCGLPGDKIQVVDGTLFVNGQNADEDLTLKKEYILPIDEWKKINVKYSKDHPDDVFPATNDSVDIMLETALLKNKSLIGRMVVRPEAEDDIQQIYHHPWSRDNFGPIEVPEGSFFVMGDNRHGAADSRYIGFIDKKNFIGTVLKRK